MAPQTLQGRVVNKVAKRVAKDTIEEYEKRYNPLESYWVMENGEKIRFKHYKSNRWLKREIYIPKGVDRKDAEALAAFRKWAWRFDMWFFAGRFGLTIGLGAILGLIPVIGDFADLVVGLLLIEYAKRQFNKRHKGELLDEERNKRFGRVLNKMRIRVLIAAGVGVVPLFGDIFDTVYKANTRNVWILEEYMKEEAHCSATNVEMAATQPTQPVQSHHPRGGR